MATLLQINTMVNSGSTGKIAEEIGITVINKGWSSYIAFGRNQRESKSELIRIGTDADIRMHGLSTRFFDNHCFASTKATEKFVSHLKEIHPDIIHLHNIHGYYLNMEVLFKYLSEANVPVVWTLHDCWPMTGHCSYFDFVNCNKWETECHDCPNLRAYPETLFWDRSRKNFNKKRKVITAYPNITFVTPSEWLKDIVKRSFLKDYDVKVINNGINLEIFKPYDNNEVRNKYGIQKDVKLIIGVASVWDRRKGLADFIELGKLLREDERILLVGLKKEQTEGLPQNIIPLQRTENMQQLAALYSTADVFVNPTWVDNFPTTNIEALACGTPIVTYRTGGSPEAVSKETGAVVERGNVQALYDAISEIEKQGKKSFVDLCRNRAVSLYNKDDRFIDYFNLYKSLLHV